MKPYEIRNLSPEELDNKFLEIKKELYDLRTRNRMGRVENPGRIKQVKRDIARIKTIKKEREK